MTFRLDLNTLQPVLVGGDLVRLTDPLEVLAQRIMVALRVRQGEAISGQLVGLNHEIVTGPDPILAANEVRRVIGNVPGVLSVDTVEVATPDPDPNRKRRISWAVTPETGQQITGETVV